MVSDVRTSDADETLNSRRLAKRFVRSERRKSLPHGWRLSKHRHVIWSSTEAGHDAQNWSCGTWENLTDRTPGKAEKNRFPLRPGTVSRKWYGYTGLNYPNGTNDARVRQHGTPCRPHVGVFVFISQVEDDFF